MQPQIQTQIKEKDLNQPIILGTFNPQVKLGDIASLGDNLQGNGNVSESNHPHI